MRVSVYLPLLLSAVVALAAPALTRRLPPAQATRTLVTGAALSAATSTWGLVLLSLTLLTWTPPATERGARSPVPAVVAAAAAASLLLAGARASRVVRRRRQTEQAMRRLCRLCNPTGELAVVDDPTPHAFAVPGRLRRPGRILVSTGLLRASDATDRRVVLAHERAHLSHSHHLLRATTDLAAAVNPLLAPARTAVRYLVERWADEVAATDLGSRRDTATSLAKLALATTSTPSGAISGAGLAFHRHAVTARVRALQRPPSPSGRPAAIAVLLVASTTLLAAGDATLAFTRLLTHLVSW